jgi:hypothetical protein
MPRSRSGGLRARVSAWRCMNLRGRTPVRVTGITKGKDCPEVQPGSTEEPFTKFGAKTKLVSSSTWGRAVQRSVPRLIESGTLSFCRLEYRFAVERFRMTESGHFDRLFMTDDDVTISPGSQFRAAMVLAIIADALQILIFPAFFEGALSPADDILDFGVGALLVRLLGWHWEFLPSFLAKLVPGVDLVPFWTMAVVNVYRKSKRIAVAAEESHEQQPLLR